MPSNDNFDSFSVPSDRSTVPAIWFRRAIIGKRILTVKDVEKQGGDGAAVTDNGNVLPASCPTS
jgi:hypothetical protein